MLSDDEAGALSPFVVQANETDATRITATMRLNIESLKQWWSNKRNRSLTIQVALAISILGIAALDTWLTTCGFDRCPTPRQIQAYQPDEGGRIYDRSGTLMGHLAIVRR